VSAPTGIERRRMALLTPLPLRGNRRADADGRGRTSDPTLTPRQREVLGGLIRGLTNKEIAAELGIGPDAVKRVISRVLIKLDAPSRTALVQQALQTSAARLSRSRGPNALSLLDAAPVPAIVTRGAVHLVEYANAAAQKVLTQATPGRRLADLLPPATRKTIERTADETYAAGAPRVARGLPVNDSARSDTTWCRADVFMSPMYDGAQNLAGLVVFLVDVSSPARDRARPA
jgi:DNA-binding CsgD family transcriptional regulator